MKISEGVDSMRIIAIFLLALLALSQPANAQFSGGGRGGVAQAPLPSEELQTLCDGGNMAACGDLGVRYFKGNTVAKDLKKSAALFQRACDGGDAIGCFDLAESHRFGDGVTKSAAKAAGYYQRGCDGGDGVSCSELAILYNDGDGVKQDDGKIALYADRGCKAKNPLGCALLGAVYQEGTEGYSKDLKHAEELFTNACLANAKFSEKPDAASRIACPALAKLRGKPSCFSEIVVGSPTGKRHCYDEKLGWRQEDVAASPTAPVSQNALTAPPVDQVSRANISVNAGNAAYARKDYPAAAAQFASACDNGSVSACGALGEMYASGTGLARNGTRAAAPLAKACDGGITASCTKLAVLYDNGDGVSVNKALAFRLYNGACAKSDMVSCHGLGRLYESGQGTTLNVAQAASLYQKACTAGVADACSNVGTMYANGVYFAKSENQADAFYKLACRKGGSRGCQLSENLLAAREERKERALALAKQEENAKNGNETGGFYPKICTGSVATVCKEHSASTLKVASRSLQELTEVCENWRKTAKNNWDYSYYCGPMHKAIDEANFKAIPHQIELTTIEQRRLCIKTSSIRAGTRTYKTGQIGVNYSGDIVDETKQEAIMSYEHLNICKFTLPVKCSSTYNDEIFELKYNYYLDFCDRLFID